jgi:mono/diheme cytochrome c family protein
VTPGVRTPILSPWYFLALLPVLAVLPGCGGDTYSGSTVYAVRSDPIVKETSAKKVYYDEPDRPGQLPLFRVKDIDDPRNPFFETRDDLKLVDPTEMSAADRQELQDALQDVFGTPANPKVDLITPETRRLLQLQDETLKEGSRLFRLYCIQCHGVTGDGRGPTSRWINPHPRDFRQGLFKFQSVDQASDEVSRPPRRDDLFRTLRQGVEGTAMQSYSMLPDNEINALVSYIIHLSIRGEVELQVFKNSPYDKEKKLLEGSKLAKGAGITVYVKGKRTSAGIVRVIAEKWREANDEDKKIKPGEYKIKEYDEDGKPTAEFKASIQNGYDIFIGRGPVSGGCTSNCHVDFGRKSQFKFDEWGTMVRPRDLTRGQYRGGRRPLDFYYRIHSGINGSGMLKQGAKLTPDQIWDVVNFVRALPYPKMREHLQPPLD